MEGPNWTKNSIIRILESLLQIGVDLRSKHMEKTWNELYTVIEHQFGSWEEAMIELARRPVASGYLGKPEKERPRRVVRPRLNPRHSMLNLFSENGVHVSALSPSGVYSQIGDSRAVVLFCNFHKGIFEYYFTKDQYEGAKYGDFDNVIFIMARGKKLSLAIVPMQHLEEFIPQAMFTETRNGWYVLISPDKQYSFKIGGYEIHGQTVRKEYLNRLDRLSLTPEQTHRIKQELN